MAQKQLEDRCENNEKEVASIKESLDRLTNRMDEQGKVVTMLVTELTSSRSKEVADDSRGTPGMKRKQPERVEGSETTPDVLEGVGQQGKTDQGQYDRSKFKKVEMPVFSGDDPDGWLFRAGRYFDIHRSTDSEKVTVAVISFDGDALSWYRWETRDGQEFVGWDDFKIRLFIQFRPSQEGSLCAQFLAIHQAGIVAEYRRTFEALSAPVQGSSEEVLEGTFVNGLHPLIRAKVFSRETTGLRNVLRAAQLIED